MAVEFVSPCDRKEKVSAYRSASYLFCGHTPVIIVNLSDFDGAGVARSPVEFIVSQERYTIIVKVCIESHGSGRSQEKVCTISDTVDNIA